MGLRQFMIEKIRSPLLVITVLLCVPLCAAAKPSIEVSVKSRTLTLKDGVQVLLTVPVRLGAGETPTPQSEGWVWAKWPNPEFRYVDPGPKKGQIVKTAECSDGTLRDFPNGKLRSLGIDFAGTRNFSIHSVVCTDTLATDVSHGCIGVRLNDMLTLFDLVDIGTPVKINQD